MFFVQGLGSIKKFTPDQVTFTMTMDAPDNTKFFMANTNYEYSLLVLNFASKCEVEQSNDGSGTKWKNSVMTQSTRTIDPISIVLGIVIGIVIGISVLIPIHPR